MMLLTFARQSGDIASAKFWEQRPKNDCGFNPLNFPGWRHLSEDNGPQGLTAALTPREHNRNIVQSIPLAARTLAMSESA
jgi:hypothetical protein